MSELARSPSGTAAPRTRPSARPSSVRLRAYAVGFGDCLLLTVGYGSPLPDGRRERHVLVDCGSAKPARERPSLADVAAAVAEHCGGRLDVVVATQPRPEHIGGFADPVVSELLRPLRPGVVVRPWTEAPDSAARTLLRSELQPDTAAPSLLDDWGRAGRTVYVQAGDTLAVDAELPRVTVQVLGPPGEQRWPELVGPGEHFFALAAEGMLPASPALPADAWANALTTLADPGGVGVAQRLLRSLRDRPVSQELEIAAAFADLAHNTSVLLLITIGNRTLLLPGDAQAAGWAPALDRACGTDVVPKDPKLARRLAAVDIYKVGQHGDRRATPARLRGLWRRRIGSVRPLVSVLSAGPRIDRTSVADLEKLGPVHHTGALPSGVWWLDVEAPTKGREPVTATPGPVVARSRRRSGH